MARLRPLLLQAACLSHLAMASAAAVGLRRGVGLGGAVAAAATPRPVAHASVHAVSHTQGSIEAAWAQVVPDASQPRGFRLALTGVAGEMLLSWTAPVDQAAAQKTLRYGPTHTPGLQSFGPRRPGSERGIVSDSLLH